jgi:hypothetical protein
LREEKISNMVEKGFDSARLIRKETIKDAPLTAPLYSGELPKAEGFFLPKFHTSGQESE